MTIDLKPQQQRVIEDWLLEDRDAVATHVEMGFAQAERGESIDGDAALELLRRRRAERLNSRE
jgi:hypothetical protein